MTTIATALLAALDPLDMHTDKDFPAFAKFIEKHRGGVGYSSEMETLGRFHTFKANLVKIDERNAKGAERHGVNKFADLTPEEVSRIARHEPPNSPWNDQHSRSSARSSRQSTRGCALPQTPL